MSRFVTYLIAFALAVTVLWIAFAGFILPLLPPTISGGLVILGFGVILVLVALIAIFGFERSDE